MKYAIICAVALASLSSVSLQAQRNDDADLDAAFESPETVIAANEKEKPGNDETDFWGMPVFNYCPKKDDNNDESLGIYAEVFANKNCIIDTRSDEKIAEDKKRALTLQALYNLFDRYEIEGDFAKSFLILERLAALNVPRAFYLMARAYRDGEGVEKNAELMQINFLKAADLEYPGAYLQVAKNYSNGPESDWEKANQYYQLASDSGFPEASILLAKNYAAGKGTKKDLDKAFTLYKVAADAGYEEAILYVAAAYESGVGVEASIELSNAWYLKGASLGNAYAQYHLGNHFDDAYGVTENNILATQWYVLASENGDAEAMMALGMNYHDGDGVDQDFEMAAQWYMKAADLEYAPAKVGLANLYFQGKGVEKDQDKGLALYQEAIESGSSFAMVELAQAYRNRLINYRGKGEIIRLYRRAAALDDVRAVRELGLSYLYGDEVDADIEQAKSWFRKGVALGDSFSQNYLKRLIEGNQFSDVAADAAADAAEATFDD